MDGVPRGCPLRLTLAGNDRFLAIADTSRRVLRMQEYDVVRIVHLRNADRPFEGSESAARAPRLGDVGAIVSVLEEGVAFVVECVAPDGSTIWLADFFADELAPEPARL